MEKKKSRKGGGGGGELGKAEKRALAILTRPTDSAAAAAARVSREFTIAFDCSLK